MALPTRLVVPGRGRQPANPESMNTELRNVAPAVFKDRGLRRFARAPGRPAGIRSSRAPAGAAGLVHDLELHLLDLREPLPLPRDQVIHLLVQVPDLQLRLQIDPIVALRAQLVFRLQALLAPSRSGLT